MARHRAHRSPFTERPSVQYLLSPVQQVPDSGRCTSPAPAQAVSIQWFVMVGPPEQRRLVGVVTLFQADHL